MSAHGSGLGGGFGASQVGPVDVRAKILAPHRTVRQPLDHRAVLGRNSPLWLLPLADCALGDAEGGSERRLGAERFGGDVDWVHARKYRTAELERSSVSERGNLETLYDCRMTRAPVNQPEIAAFVKAARKNLALTLEAFGEAFGRTKANVHAWEKGLHEPSFALLVAISKASGVPLPGMLVPGGDGGAPTDRTVSEAQWEFLQAAEVIMSEERRRDLVRQHREMTKRFQDSLVPAQARTAKPEPKKQLDNRHKRATRRSASTKETM